MKKPIPSQSASIVQLKPPALPPLVSRRPDWRLPTGICVIVLLALAAGYFALVRPWQSKSVAVLVETMTAGPVTRVLAVNGQVAAKHSVAVRSTISGKVVNIAGDRNDQVVARTVMAHIDDTAQQALLRQAFAALDGGLVRQDQAQATVDYQSALRDNTPRLTLEDARRTLTGADKEVERLTGLLDQARNQLEQYTIVAPMDGTILSRTVEVGQVIDAQTTLFTVADLSRLVVTTDVDELYASQIHSGMAVLMRPAGQTETLPGRVSLVAPSIDAATGGLPVELSFDVDQVLPVGLSVTANIMVERQANALTALRDAIVTQGEVQSVYRVRDGRAVLTSIKSVEWPAQRLLVTSGLAVGDVVILNPSGLADGDAVTVEANE